MTPALVTELKRLERKAHAPKWRVKNVNEPKFDAQWGTDYKPIWYIEEGHGLGQGGNGPMFSTLKNITPVQVHMQEEDVKLIVALRNAAPALLEAVETMHAALEQYYTSCPHVGAPCAADCGSYAREALARVAGLLAEGREK